ncbi:hypothetical protein [Streptomyces sp. NPDC046261]|uniref:hypothetical protein n=1 Tax=Streptomyces sp. NPDC046261 TaxID=3157200 RepID=UPI0033E06192
MSEKLIVPTGIPQFTGNLETLETETKALAADAKLFRESGASVHSTFQGLSACYKAPEADKLFATTKPVETKSDAFADDLEKVTAALSAYASEVKPLATRLQNLKSDAIDFVNSIQGDDDWRKDQKKVDRNNELWRGVNETVTAFQTAERTCHDKIVALVGGKPLIVDDGSHKDNMYGYRAEDLNHAEKTPWGSMAEREYTGLAWLGHQVKSFVWDGFIVDGVWGTIKGLGTLVGTEGWDKAGQAWTGLAKLSTGIFISTTPLAAAYWMAPDDKLPKWLRDSRTAVKETGKALVAYDQWGKNPARAAGGVTFNVLTTVFTGGSGAAAKGGAVAKTLSTLGKAGRIVDPITYVGKAGKITFVKVGDLMSGLKNLRVGSTIHLAEGAFKVTDESGAAATLPARPANVPESAVPFLDPKNKVVYLDKSSGKFFNEHGKELAPPKKELSAAERSAAEAAERQRPHSTVSEHDRVPAGVAARGGGHIPAGGHAPGGGAGHAPGGGAGGHVPGGAAHDLGRGPSASHEPPRGGIPERGGISHGADNGTDATRPRDTGAGNGHGAGHVAGSGAHDAGHVPDHGTSHGAESGTHAGGPEHSDSGTGSGHSSHEAGNGRGAAHDPYVGMTPEEVMRKQVDRANNEAGYFERYYKNNGNRIRLNRYDESGTVPPQLVWDSAKNKWVSVSDAPPPLPEKYLGDPLKRGRETATTQAINALDDASRTRHSAIAADKLAEDQLKHAREAFEADGSPANEAAVHAAEAAHKPLHRDMSKASEAYGEAIAQHHVIPEHYPNAKMETLDGPLNGNDQFDQVWLREDGGYVVVEAKSSTRTDLGARNLPSGRRVMQGTREYFMDIIREMTERGRENPNELRLAEALEEALDDGKLDYILVKGNPNAGQYAGYTMQKFDIR